MELFGQTLREFHVFFSTMQWDFLFHFWEKSLFLPTSWGKVTAHQSAHVTCHIFQTNKRKCQRVCAATRTWSADKTTRKTLNSFIWEVLHFFIFLSTKNIKMNKMIKVKYRKEKVCSNYRQSCYFLKYHETTAMGMFDFWEKNLSDSNLMHLKKRLISSYVIFCVYI